MQILALNQPSDFGHRRSTSTNLRVLGSEVRSVMSEYESRVTRHVRDVVRFIECSIVEVDYGPTMDLVLKELRISARICRGVVG